MKEDYIRGYLDGLRNLMSEINEREAAGLPVSVQDIKDAIKGLCEIMCK